jgi:hypothetical protein
MKYIVVTWMLVLAASNTGAATSTIYRCGPDGRDYSQVPCPGGKALDASDPRTGAQRAEALEVAARDRRRAAELERERRAQEASVKPSSASGFNARPAPPTALAAKADRGQPRKRHTKVKRTPIDAAAPDAKAERKRRK